MQRFAKVLALGTALTGLGLVGAGTALADSAPLLPPVGVRPLSGGQSPALRAQMLAGANGSPGNGTGYTQPW
jgi:hypothetical protein